MVANPEIGAPKLRRFYLTFGVMYRHEPHPYWAGADPDGWLLVLAPDEEQARLLVRSFIGLKWSHMTDAAHFEEIEKQGHWYPKGELAQISTNGTIIPEGSGLRPQFGTSSPEYYGHDSNEIVAVRILGQLKHGSDADAIEKLGYEVEYYHPQCWIEGVQSFAEVHEMDRAVLAGELDWANPYECPVCETSIT